MCEFLHIPWELAPHSLYEISVRVAFFADHHASRAFKGRSSSLHNVLVSGAPWWPNGVVTTYDQETETADVLPFLKGRLGDDRVAGVCVRVPRKLKIYLLEPES